MDLTLGQLGTLSIERSALQRFTSYKQWTPPFTCIEVSHFDHCFVTIGTDLESCIKCCFVTQVPQLREQIQLRKQIQLRGSVLQIKGQNTFSLFLTRTNYSNKLSRES